MIFSLQNPDCNIRIEYLNRAVNLVPSLFSKIRYLIVGGVQREGVDQKWLMIP